MLTSLSFGITDENKKKRKIKSVLKKLLLKADESCPPIDFKNYTSKDFII